MDPSATWREMADPDTNSALRWELAIALRNWIQRDGFPPEITGNVVFDKLAALATCDVIIKRM